MIPDEIYEMINKNIEKRPSDTDVNFNYVHQENVYLIIEKTIDLLQHRTTANVRFRFLRKIFTQIAKATSYIRKRYTQFQCKDKE